MSYPTDLFSSLPTESTGDDAGNEPAASVSGPAPHEEAYSFVPPQATVSSPSIDDLWHRALRKLWTEAACWRDGDPCLPCDSPVFPGQERLYSVGDQDWSNEWPFPDAGANHRWVVGLGTWRARSVLDAISCEQCLHVVLDQWLFFPCLCADPQRKSIPSPASSWGFGSGMGTPTVDNCHCPP